MYLGNAVPDFIVKTLICAGFDNAMSLTGINEEDIILIEQYAAENCRHLIDLDIDEKGTFKLKPGHRKLVLNLSEKVIKYLEDKTLDKTKDKASKKKLDQSKENRTHNEYEEIELLSKQEITELKANLISKLIACARLNGLSIEFTEKEIGDIETYISYSRTATNKPSYKCLVKCPFCTKFVPCTHNGHWQTSNLDKHIKKEAKLITNKLANKPANLSHSQNLRQNSTTQISSHTFENLVKNSELNDNSNKESNQSNKERNYQQTSTVESELNAFLGITEK